MNKLYSVHDHWTDIAKKNDVDIESIDGVIAGIKVNGEDFGGISWTQVFTGDVVASGEAAPFSGTIPAELSGADTIKVIYNNNVYILNKQTQGEIYYYGATIGETPSDIDFSVYPFVIVHVNDNNVSLYTRSPGPQDLTIFELQSGGGGESDFSTAEMTIVAESEYVDGLTIDIAKNSGLEILNAPDVGTYQTVLYKGVGHAYLFENLHPNIVVTGNAVYDTMLGIITITGDCTITIS